MLVEIENYRGYKVQFDTEIERFTYELEENHQREKQSYASVKKEIDEYIKGNVSFQPFYIINSEGTKILIEGIRKDKKFVYSASWGDRKEFLDPGYKYVGEWFLYNPESHDQILANIVDRQVKIDNINNEMRSYKSQIKGISLQELAKKYFPQ